MAFHLGLFLEEVGRLEPLVLFLCFSGGYNLAAEEDHLSLLNLFLDVALPSGQSQAGIRLDAVPIFHMQFVLILLLLLHLFLYLFLLLQLGFLLFLDLPLQILDDEFNQLILPILLDNILFFLQQRVIFILDHVFAFGVVEQRHNFGPFFAVLADLPHCDEFFVQGPLFVEVGVDVVEPSLSALLARFVCVHVPSEEELAGYLTPHANGIVLLLLEEYFLQNMILLLSPFRTSTLFEHGVHVVFDEANRLMRGKIGYLLIISVFLNRQRSTSWVTVLLCF